MSSPSINLYWIEERCHKDMLAKMKGFPRMGSGMLSFIDCLGMKCHGDS